MTLYKALKMFVAGEYEGNPIEECHTSSYNMKISISNKENLEKNIVYLFFDREEFLKMYNANNDYNDHLISAAFSNRYYSSDYGRLVFINYDDSEYNFKEGYLIREFSDENIEKFKEILFMTSKVLYKKISDDFDSNLEDACRFLYSKFARNIDYIISEYSELYDAALVIGLRKYLERRGCGIFSVFLIHEMICQRKYVTTIGNIIRLYEEYNAEDEDIVSLLKKMIISKDLQEDEDYFEDYYAYFESENFDSVEFNRVVSRKLDQIIESIEESENSEEIKKENEIYSIIDKMGYQFDRWEDFPKEKRNNKYRFKIIGFDKGKVTVLKHSVGWTYASETYKMGLEDFLNFLYHPELFD